MITRLTPSGPFLPWIQGKKGPGRWVPGWIVEAHRAILDKPTPRGWALDALDDLAAERRGR